MSRDDLRLHLGVRAPECTRAEPKLAGTFLAKAEDDADRGHRPGNHGRVRSQAVFCRTDIIKGWVGFFSSQLSGI
jgi:hypothetical protein